MDAVAAGVWVGVVTSGQRSWAEPLVRQLVGEGLIETIVTADDVTKPVPGPEAYPLALAELGMRPKNALAFTGSAAGLRAANSAGLATVVVTDDPAAAGISRLPPRSARTTAAPNRYSSRIANACTGTGGRRTKGQPRSISMTALKSLSAWSAANFA